VYHYRTGTVFDDAPLHHGLLHDDRARLGCSLDGSGDDALDEARDHGLAVAVTGEGGGRRVRVEPFVQTALPMLLSGSKWA